VNATALSTGDVAFKVYKITGTLSATGTSIAIALPSYITFSNIVGFVGGTRDGTPGTTFLSFSWSGWDVSVQVNNVGNIVLLPTGAASGSKPFQCLIFYV